VTAGIDLALSLEEDHGRELARHSERGKFTDAVGGLPFPLYPDKKTVYWPVQTSDLGTIAPERTDPRGSAVLHIGRWGPFATLPSMHNLVAEVQSITRGKP
jgi:hypothetical protein